MLTDSFNRNHDYLRISLTDKCNLRCAYCMPVDLPKGFYNGMVRMNADEIEQIATLFVKLGVKKIRLTGGEPLVRKDAASIIQRLSKLPVQLAISTNGVYVDEFINTFQQAGIRSVNISLDSLYADQFKAITNRDYFNRVMTNIELLLAAGFHVKINMVVLKDINHKEIPRFIDWTKDNPLHIRFIEYMPFSGNGWSHLQVFPVKDLLDLVSSHVSFEKLTDHPNDTARNFRATGHQGTFAFISTMSDPFCSGCNRLRLTADGKIKNCLFSKGEVDLLTALRNGEDPEPLILMCVMKKAKERGGQMNQELEKIEGTAIQNRSMVAIGG